LLVVLVLNFALLKLIFKVSTGTLLDTDGNKIDKKIGMHSILHRFLVLNRGLLNSWDDIGREYE